MSRNLHLREYVQWLNRAEVDLSLGANLEALLCQIRDASEVLRERSRLSRIGESLHRRNAELTKVVTDARILRQTREHGWLKVLVELTRSWRYRVGGKAHEEEEVEIRLFTLDEEGCVLSDRMVQEWLDSDTADSLIIPVNAPPPALGGQPNGYRREQAVAYAECYWREPNPLYRYFAVDCTNFISQSLHAGGAPMRGFGNRGEGWWYQRGEAEHRWSFSWAVAHSLRWYLADSKAGLRAQEKGGAKELSLGDVISYDFDGDGKWQHNAIVTAYDGNGEPLVNAHTSNVRHRYWDYQASYAWSARTQYKFFHIVVD